MRTPSQYWFAFAAAWAVVLSAMGWLTLKALELDRAEALARRQAELEEDVGLALWRMDANLMPHLAREATRPYAVYRNEPQPPGGARQPHAASASPLTERSEYVLVNFQVEPGNRWSSPQLLEQHASAAAADADSEPPDLSRAMLARLQREASYDWLTSALPAEPLPPGNVSPEQASGYSKILQNSAVLLEPTELLPPSSAPPSTEPPILPDDFRQQRAQARAGNDLRNRDAALQSYAQQQLFDQRAQRPEPAVETVREGVSQPMWVGSQLLLARRVEVGQQVVIQGCCLDWPRIRERLLAEIADLLPRADLEPVTDPRRAPVGRMLATLPVQLVVPAAEAGPAHWSAVRAALVLAWSCLFLASVAAGVLLHGVLALSERRGAFVSAVTHELRTPLTTFRMYSEMLAQGMVPDEAKRQHYLHTLRVEADRLAHLVDNVLSYARLERGRQHRHREIVAVASMLERMHQRLQERTAQADMQLVLDLAGDADDATLRTDPAAVEQIVFNLVDNACKYARAAPDRRIHVDVTRHGDDVRFRVRDHGPGIDRHEAKRLFRPFSKSATDAANSAPGVGLGLALCRRLARELGGSLAWQPIPGPGASFVLTLPTRSGLEA